MENGFLYQVRPLKYQVMFFGFSNALASFQG